MRGLLLLVLLAVFAGWIYSLLSPDDFPAPPAGEREPPAAAAVEGRPNHAYPTEEYDRIRRLRQQGDILPLQTILQRARQQRPGRVLESSLQHRQAGYVYHLELVDDRGRVWEMAFDAATGDVLENHREE